jgi:hypothetical protein
MMPKLSSSWGTGEDKALGDRPGKRLLGGANPTSSKEALCLGLLRGDEGCGGAGKEVSGGAGDLVD